MEIFRLRRGDYSIRVKRHSYMKKKAVVTGILYILTMII